MSSHEHMKRRNFLGILAATLAVPGCAVWNAVKPFLPVPTVILRPREMMALGSQKETRKFVVGMSCSTRSGFLEPTRDGEWVVERVDARRGIVCLKRKENNRARAH